MVNYILADYKRVLGRVPRIVFLEIFELYFIFVILSSWSNAAGNYTSVKLMETSVSFFANAFMILVATMDFVQSFNYDFSAKTIQVAIGLGVSRLQIVLAKLIQTTLVIVTDVLITFGICVVLSVITGAPLVSYQISQIWVVALNSILLSSCATALTMPLIFRTKSMVLSLVTFSVIWLGLITYVLRIVLRTAPVFVSRLQLDRLTPDSCIGEILTDGFIGRFQLMPWIGTIFWFALGIYLTWLVFRKMELDF